MEDIFVAKINTNGEPQWHAILGAGGGNQGNDIVLDNGDLYIAGFSHAAWGNMILPKPASDSGQDVSVLKIDTDGNFLWHAMAGGYVGDIGNGITADGSGNVYTTGYSFLPWLCVDPPLHEHSGNPTPFNYGIYHTDIFVAKIDPAASAIDPNVDSDGDTVPDFCDPCAIDADKIEPGICGCGIADTDSDGDLTLDCNDQCDQDPLKTEPGVCGCGVADTDTDLDGTADCIDGCPSDINKTDAGVCGCGVSDIDTDGDGVADCIDLCPGDTGKVDPGVCGCGVADTDSDGDGTFACHEQCDEDPLKTEPGVCGCGVADTDTDGDLTLDCNDQCDQDPLKTEPGACGCGVLDTDGDGDGTADCIDGCPADFNKTAPGVCGCGVADTDSDGDGVADCVDDCPNDPANNCGGDSLGPVVTIFPPAPVPIDAQSFPILADVDDTGTGGSNIAEAVCSFDGVESAMVAEDQAFDSPLEGVLASVPLPLSGVGVYRLCVTGWDQPGNTGESCVFIPVYDPNGGFVTGGGWIRSPEGAYVAEPALVGKANFGFVSKYKKKENFPTGSTEFFFKAGNLNFHSNLYDWLVVAGAKAMYKGVGTINGEGEYKFMLTARDGELTNNGESDAFRIRIWEEDSQGAETVIYDNQWYEAEDADATTVVEGGSIVIHKKK
jgi:hypothetical protein